MNNAQRKGNGQGKQQAMNNAQRKGNGQGKQQAMNNAQRKGNGQGKQQAMNNAQRKGNGQGKHHGMRYAQRNGQGPQQAGDQIKQPRRYGKGSSDCTGYKNLQEKKLRRGNGNQPAQLNRS
ncbi:hypothetical protein VQ7734_04578 [Vibrio quintilis]|uniref:Uncharacterized protein n=2 Tax=Vibrio quintilis TaxID=1117707 RepID=A0A1M7Z2C9_9VIBR|nr:hypothetical protein VQ7734_04578 [Vibrio quintilis]